MKKLLLFLLLAWPCLAKAQYFETGQDPASLKWRQINTENFQLIYPDYYENQAQKLAAIMETVYKKAGKSLDYSPKRISIILHTQTVKSNGLVAWAPKRVEFYTIPHQGIYSQDWIEQLAMHEFRHIVQIDKINHELPDIIKLVMGQQGTALVFGAYLPWWFIEGDAVVTETAFSNSGRGRFPSFLMDHRALAVEKGNYKYDKAYNGSFKNYVPDHYQLGYYLVGAARARYGSHLWSETLNRVGGKPFSFNPFNKVLKQKTGFSKVQLYNSVFDSLQKVWLAEDEKYTSPVFQVVSPQHEIYTSYNYNHWLDDSTVVSYKTALNKIPAFVKIDIGGNEKEILQPGRIFRESVNYRGEWLVFSEQAPDPRWQHSGESLIRLMNLETGEKKSIQPEFTAFAPAISPLNDKVVVVESNFASQYFLTVYSISSGQMLQRFSTVENNYFFQPEWLNENEIVAVVLFDKGMRLAKINMATQEMELLVDRDLGNIKHLRIAGNQLFFVSSYTAKNSLFKMDLNNNSIQQVFAPRFGVESPAISSNLKNVVLSDYTAEGFRLIKFAHTAETGKPLNRIDRGTYAMAEKLAAQEPGVFNFSEIDTVQFESKKYVKAAHLLNFHSWAPAAVETSNYQITPGVSLLSQNKLGTTELNIGFEWQTDERTGNFYGRYTYKGWYPVFDFEVNSGKSATKAPIIEQVLDPNGEVISQDTVLRRFTWNETNLGLDVRVPLDFSKGKYSRFLQPEIKYDFTLYDHDRSTPDQFFNGNYQSVTYRLYYQQLLRQSSQDVFPNFGFAIDGIYRHSPMGKTDLGNLALGQTYLYFPGLMGNHGIRLYNAYQTKTAANNYSFSDAIRYPRGWGKINSNRMYSLAFDYKMPLFYPEWTWGSLMYWQRLKASVFFDFAWLEANVFENGHVAGIFNSNFSSWGAELTGDVNFLRFYAPVEIGVRASYLPKTQKVYFDLLFSIDFNSL